MFLGFVGIICQLFWWLPLFAGAGFLYRHEWKSAIIALTIAVLMLGLTKGIEELYELLSSHGVDL